MKIFIDFDDTLINRTQMTKDIFAAFGLLSVDELMNHYAEFRKSSPFTIQAFVDYLNRHGIDGDRLRTLFKEHAARANDYVFPDAEPFLQALKDAGHELILLSFDAEPDFWQWPKVYASGLNAHFEEIYVTDQAKPEVLKSLGITEPFVFIDDKPGEIAIMQAAYPGAYCLKHTPGSPLTDHIGQIAEMI